ncbi:hypothetical protein [Salinibacterium sp.]|nr:hypothetical protein [Salinibacterium sp.]
MVREAPHDREMVGLFLSPAARSDVIEYIAGRIDSDDLADRAWARYGLG